MTESTESPPENKELSGEPATFSGEPAPIYVNQAGPQVAMGMQQSTNAIASLVLGILALLSLLVLPGCNICLSIPGVVLGVGDRKIMAANPSHPDKGMVNAAFIINIISLIIGALIVIFMVVFIGILASDPYAY